MKKNTQPGEGGAKRNTQPGEGGAKNRRGKRWLAPLVCLLTGLAGGAWKWLQGERSEALLLLMLGAAAAAALWYYPVQKAKTEALRRSRELTDSYPDLVTRLGLYMNAGLNLRSAWMRLVSEYRKEREAGGRKRAAYEEMEFTAKEMLGGVFEDIAYGAFGRRCGTPEYLRLGGLLESYVQQGNRDLLPLLESEVTSSLALSLQNVKRRGERTQTVLLMPILLLFLLTLLLVVVPAYFQLEGSI